MLSIIACACAASVAVVGYEGTSASDGAFLCVGLAAVALLVVLARYPRAALTVALVFLTSPLPLLLSMQRSAMVSAILLGGAGLGLALSTPLRSMSRDPMVLPIGIFTIYGTVSAVYGLTAGNEIGYVWGDFFQVVEFALVYFLVAQLMKDGATVRRTLSVLLVSMLVTIVMELLLFGLGPNDTGLLPSWDGSYGSELVRTIDINATILFAILVNVFAISRSRRQRFWICTALVLTIATIALSLSRGLWLCTLAVGVASLLLQRGEARKRLLKTYTAACVAVVLVSTVFQVGSDSDSNLLGVLEERIVYGGEQVAEGFAGTETMATRRFLEMVIVGPQVLANPWMGRGLGATYVIAGFAVLDSGTEVQIDHHFIHNLYLGTAFRMGGIGLGLLLWIFACYFRRVRRVFQEMLPNVDRALVVGCVSAVVGQLILSNTQPSVIDHPTCALVAGAMALSFRVAKSSLAYERQGEIGE
jgi:hypothetical protein